MDAPKDLRGALLRFRVIAWIVGVLLIPLMFVAWPMDLFGGDDRLVAIIGPIHGFGYMVYMALAFDLARRAEWSLWPRMVLLLLAGTVPLLSFKAERWAVHTVAAETAEQPEPAVSTSTP
ncbi:MAG: DUF3817 domain-containing protein [Stackebrandtia sp.]